MRTNGTTTYNYVYSGSQLSWMTVSDGTVDIEMHFTYDASGRPLAVKYCGATYYYALNLQGDVVAILNSSGSAVVYYTYDAWGNPLTISGSMVNTLGEWNPLRYRGYVYDPETGLYYLQSRYYNPTWGRFINADSQLNPKDGLVGCNMFAYCGNNPIMLSDPSGHSAVLALILCGVALVGMGLTIAGVATDDNTLTAVGLGMVGAAALVSGGIAIATGATLSGVIGGITTAAGVGSLTFMSAEIQEASGNGNWIMDTTGMNSGVYNTLMLTTAAIATLGTAASSITSSFNINSINGFGKYGDYYGMNFQTGAGKTRVLSFHTHSHGNGVWGYHWQLQKWNPVTQKTTGTIGRWLWWNLQKIVFHT